MARMIPGMIPADTRSDAEKKVFPILKDRLNDNFTVFHSYNMLTHNRQNKFLEGEIDFLIFSPERGILVLEVKSGSIIFDGDSGTWYQNDLPLKQSPFAQSLKTKYQLLDYLTKELGVAPNIPVCHAVCFPDIELENNKMPPGADTDICIDAPKMNKLQDTIINIMEHFHKTNHSTIDVKQSEQVRKILMPHFEYALTLANRIRQEEAQIISLTEDQCQMLDFIQNHKKALIQGCAGSGKTILAVKKAKELAASGNSVLLLAYNKLLGERLSDSVKGIPGITAATYHDYCVKILESAGKLPAKLDLQKYWDEDIPQAFAEHIKDNPLKYDAVIIDEGQDFRIEYWLTIEELRKPDSYLYIFFDPEQNLSKTGMEFPIDEQPYILSVNCRNTHNIFNLLKSYTQVKMRVNEGTPEGEQVRHFTGITDRQRYRQLKDIVIELIDEQNLKPEDIVILGGHSIEKTCLNKRTNLGNYNVTEIPQEGPNLIHYHTYMKFKGCEANAVILLDVDKNDPRWDANRLYTAASRAKHLLFIIHKD